MVSWQRTSNLVCRRNRACSDFAGAARRCKQIICLPTKPLPSPVGSSEQKKPRSKPEFVSQIDFLDQLVGQDSLCTTLGDQLTIIHDIGGFADI